MTPSVAIYKPPAEVLDRILMLLAGDADWKLVSRRKMPVTTQQLATSFPEGGLRNMLNFRLVCRRFNDIYKLRFCPSPPILRLPKECLRNILDYLSPDPRDTNNFRLVNKRFDVIYRLRFHSSPAIFKLPAEVLDYILDYVAHKPRGMVKIENRSSLSLESFADIKTPNETNQLKNLRLVCRKFAELGLQRLFARFTTRFSLEGFEVLQKIAEQRHIATKVKRFTYMVPRFHLQDKAGFERLLQRQHAETENNLGRLNRELQRTERPRLERLQSEHTTMQIRARIKHSRHLESRILEAKQRADNQNRITEDGIDSRGLLFAFRVFRGLEQIRLLRLEDEHDANWARFLRDRHQAKFSWTRACEQAATALTLAFLQSNAKLRRFSCRFVDLGAPLSLTRSSKLAISKVVERLECLELQLVNDYRTDLDEELTRLSEFCRGVLSRTILLVGLHIGFGRYVSIPLEDIFHKMKWSNLRYIGIHMWCLNEWEIIRLLRRHPNLKAVRFRYIQLRSGSRWDNVLRVIRHEFEMKWISLFGIGYGSQDLGGVAFNYVDSDSDDMHLSDSEDADEETEDEAEASSSAQDASDSEDMVENQEVDEWEDSEGSNGTNNDDEASEDEQGNHNAFISDSAMVYHSTLPEPPITDVSRGILGNSPQCDCYEDLGDNGATVPRSQWKRWEHWAVRRCPRHNSRQSGEAVLSS
ncbi:uncharacterized protein BP5553_07949 [Venustampulla echinocandica]|uniref:F-box domain-containing protein n=1 Tax=Venustampulla echinocandica TaxID=2656787 RepID=A0A370TFC8_9HELO|nr:uncharacterized protein BP5553_07949 [Venustampulla echinocandica]RDL33581.1 hypothetical protein BP5553_07949 [Venustampulla echinocandica]